MTVEDKVKAVAAEEARHLQALTNDAVRSGAFLYPFKVSSTTSYGDHPA